MTAAKDRRTSDSSEADARVLGLASQHTGDLGGAAFRSPKATTQAPEIHVYPESDIPALTETTPTPFGPEEIAAALAAAPEADDANDPIDWQQGILTPGGGVDATLQALRAGRTNLPGLP